MINNQKLLALNVAIQAMEFVHGSVTGDPEFEHDIEPKKCDCEYGKSIRTLTVMRQDLKAKR